MAKTKFEKLDLQTKDWTAINIQKIGELFPNVITEYETEQGEITKGIDFELLQQLLSKELVDGTKEKYQLNWPGKKAALLKANTPITETLRPDIANSKNWDNTENVFIEGDNFTALKILQESYLGKIKMIYIDPPYNTGKDFVYSDKFTIDKSEYAEKIGQYDEENNKLFKENTRTNPRYHSDWLSMMYERLYIARDLLREDGVIFISIDDNEVHNLRKICDEIFGEENFITNYCWHNNVKGRQMDHFIKNTFENILVYSKNIYNLKINSEVEKIDTENLEHDKISFFKKDYPLHNGTADFHINNRPNLCYTIYYNNKLKKVEIIDEKIIKDGIYYLGEISEKGEYLLQNGYVRIIPKYNKTYSNQRVWRWGKEKFLKEYKTELIFEKEKDGFYIYQKKRFTDGKHEKKQKNYINIDGGKDKTYLANLFGGLKVFESPKPTDLVKFLTNVSILPNNNDIILDFFAGSGTTAHAVMAQNAEDGGNRKFIMVQLDEETDEKSEAYKAGYKTIAELSRERIRRAGEKIVVENKDKLATRETELDIGFRAFRVDSTNMKDVYYHPKDLKQDNLLDLVDTIKADRTPEDLLIQVLLDKALTLDLPIKTQKFKNNTVYIVGDNDLIVCMDTVLDADIIDDLAQLGADTAVFRDSSFATEADRIKLETHFKRLSPRDTRILVI